MGKTKTSLDLAKALNGEIISADSMQIYRQMSIGTAKPTAEEQSQVPHHLIDFVNPNDNYSVAQYAKAARSAIADIVSRGKQPIIVGGTGLYIHSLIYQLDFSSTDHDNTVRSKLNAMLQSDGALALHNLLAERAPEIAKQIHPNNSKRVIRALEIVLADKTVKSFKTAPQLSNDYTFNYFVLNRDRAELYNRINRRVDLMLEAGLVKEVKQLVDTGLTGENQSMRAIGYKEVYDFLINKTTYQEMVTTLKQNSRRYAKRQLTWFKRYDFVDWINLSIRKTNQSVIEYIIDKIN